jgi:hypothetical protein
MDGTHHTLRALPGVSVSQDAWPVFQPTRRGIIVPWGSVFPSTYKNGGNTMERAITSHKTRDLFGHESYSVKRSYLKSAGLLIDVTEKAFALGLIAIQQIRNTERDFDICITPHVHEECVRWTELDGSVRKIRTTETIRLECLLSSANAELRFLEVIRGNAPKSKTWIFKHFWTSRHIYPETEDTRRLALHVGPGDTDAPVITIMMPSELQHGS